MNMLCKWEIYDECLECCKNVGIYLYRERDASHHEVFTSVRSAYEYMYKQSNLT